jgi:radical SAM-linked protein
MSHLDNLRLIERTVRRSRIPVAYSQGYHPTMKFSFGPPLPLGLTSEAEYVDITLDVNMMPHMIDSLRQAMPEGLTLHEAAAVLGKAKSLSSMLNRAVYTLPLQKIIDRRELDDRIAELLVAATITVERVGKSKTTTVDIRPAIYSLTVDDDAVAMTLGIGEGGYARPVEVLHQLCEAGQVPVLAQYLHRRAMYRQEENDHIINAMDV